MANTNNKTGNRSSSVKVDNLPNRPIDKHFDRFNVSYQNETNRLIQNICIPILYFSLFGLAWAMPFPHIKFLGQYNSFVNWASFLMAFMVFYYYRLSAVLSYIILIIIMFFSFGIIGLDNWAKAGGLALGVLSLALFIAAWIGLFIGNKIEGRQPLFANGVRFILLGPGWLLHFILLKLKVNY